MINQPLVRFAFLGTSRFSVLVLDELEKVGLMPTLIVTTPDKPQGRGLRLTSCPVKEWAQVRKIKMFEPTNLDATFTERLRTETYEKKLDVFVVVSYGKIIPRSILDIPPRHTLNVHASLLPSYRGASPLQSAMLDDAKETGITIIRLDEKMDHGPIVAMQKVAVNEWPIYEDFESTMAHESGMLLAKFLPEWVAGRIGEKEQEHSRATYTKKITKEDGLINVADLNADAPAERAYAAFRKIQAFHEWPTAYFFTERSGKKMRVKITRASFKDGHVRIEKVVPEGSREMDYGDYLKGTGR